MLSRVGLTADRKPRDEATYKISFPAHSPFRAVAWERDYTVRIHVGRESISRKARMRYARRRVSLLWLTLLLFISACIYVLSARYSAGTVARPPYRMVLGLNYWEQFNMAMNNFFQLTSLAAQWHSRTVIPFTYSSRLYGLKNYKPDDHIDEVQEALSLSAIYDMESMDAVVTELGLPALVTFEEFIKYAHRTLVVAHFVSEKAAHEIPVLQGPVKEYLEDKFVNNNVVDCHTQLTGFSDELLSRLNREAMRYKVSTFSIEKYFCVNMSQHTTPQELATKMEIHNKNSDVSVIVFNWRGSSEKAMLTAGPRGRHPNNRLIISAPKLPNHSIIRHSGRVSAAATQYMKHLDLTGNYLAINFRSEKMGLRENRFPGNTRKCMESVLRLRDHIVTKVTSLRTVIFTDYGPYSSDSCLKCKGASIVSKELAKAGEGFTPIHYDPVAHGEVGDRGFAGAVEMEVIASASFVILCGGGSYQNQVAQRFLKGQESDPGVQRLYMVCTDDASVIEHTQS